MKKILWITVVMLILSTFLFAGEADDLGSEINIAVNEAIEVAMANNIDTSIRNANSAKDQVKNYSRAVEYNSRLLEVELLRFKAGQSNSRIVLEREDIRGVRLKRIALPCAFIPQAKREFLLERYGLTAQGLVRAVLNELGYGKVGKSASCGRNSNRA